MRVLQAAALLALMAPAALAEEVRNPLEDSATWEDYLRANVVGDAETLDGSGLFEIVAPYRAADAATVPVEFRQVDPAATIRKATLVIDENPAPVAAVFTFGPAMAPLDMEVRVRVDQYFNVRLIAETDDGLFMDGRFVKASGGCSAPATRDPQAALASMGEMQLRGFAPEEAQMSVARGEAQIMIRHPNYSGLQRDQLSQLFIPPHFIDTLEVRQGDELLFSMTGGISFSENPVFRFSYDDDGSAALTVRATDTEGNSFEEVLPKGGAS